MTSHSFVYLIEFPHSMKIGISSNPQNRLKQHKQNLRSLGIDDTEKNVWFSDKIYNAPQIERSVVKRFSQNGMEWFHGDFNDVLEFIVGIGFRKNKTEKEIYEEKRSDDFLNIICNKYKELEYSSAQAFLIVMQYQRLLMKQSFDLLVQDYTNVGENPPEDNVYIFYEKLHNDASWLEAIIEFIEFKKRFIAKNSCDYSDEDIATLFLLDFLESLGMKPYDPFIRGIDA